MTKTGHTPGPWTTGDLLTNQGQVAIMAGDDRVALVDAPEAHGVKPANRWKMESETRSANAHLIAAAPDLLEEMRIAVAVLERGETPDLNDMRAAIALAEGRASLPTET